MPILPSGGGYPGIIGEAELIASAVASVAADKAASTADAADADAARVAAQSDAAAVAAAKAAAVPDSADVAAAKAQAQSDAQTIADLVPGATADAEAVATAKEDAIVATLAIEEMRAGLSINATETQHGVVRLATEVEASTGTDTAKAVTPAGVKASILANATAPVAATISTAGVVVLAGGPDETNNPGSTKVLTAGHFNAAGVTLLDAVGGMMFANEFYANVIVGRDSGLFINRNADGWRMQIGTGTPADTVADAYGVGSSNGVWRVGQNMGGESLRLTDGTFSTILRTTPWYGDAMSFGFEFLEGAAQTGSLSVGMGGYVNLTGSSGASLTTPGGGQVFCSMEGVMIDGIGLGFFGASRVAKQTGTPANATDLASAIALVNNLKAKLIAYGLIA